MRVLGFNRRTHEATYVRKHFIGEIYRLNCSGKEVYIPALVGRWALTDSALTCEHCKRMVAKKEAESR